MNDPNGPLYWRGRYHRFYQYSPVISIAGPKYWGHAISSDLVHWKNLGIALAPTPDGPDKNGCWSGSAVINNGVPTLVYTGVTWAAEAEEAERKKGLVPERQMVAIAADSHDGDLTKWMKIPQNPVLAAPPAGMRAVGSFYRGNPFCWLRVATGYLRGTYSDHQFEQQSNGQIDYGSAAYARKTMADEKGRRIWWAWIHEKRNLNAQQAAGWAGVMSVPKLLTFLRDGTLGVEPVPEMKILRRQEKRVSNQIIEPGGPLLLKAFESDCAEIVLVLCRNHVPAASQGEDHGPRNEERAARRTAKGTCGIVH